MATRLLIGLLWLLHHLPMRVQAALGTALGWLLFHLARERRAIAMRNVELCFPDESPAWRRRIVAEHFGWLGCSLLERGMLWFAPVERIRGLIEIEGDVGYAERNPGQPVMWLVPHFMALDIAAVAALLFQTRPAASIYQAQSNPVMDQMMRRGRLRFGESAIFARSETALPLVRAIKQGRVFFNLPDMDFGKRDAAFVPFFGVPAATLLAPSRMARSLRMKVQPIVATMRPGGAGWHVHFHEPWEHWPTDDALADTAAMNRWIEGEIRRNPAQYLWVHKRFKSTPPGGTKRYAGS